ncbi:MAG: hypothetical protein ABWY35_09460 [Pseudorhodoplanes sp.]
MTGFAAWQVGQDELRGESAAQDTAYDNAAHAGFAPELHRLLKGLSTLFLDNVRHLEDAVSQVTELVTRDGMPDKKLIVALQNFDRLKQEFEALGGALAHYADAADGPLTDEALAQFGRQVIGTIALADLRMRLLDHLRPAAPAIALSDPPAEEIDVDVVF